MAKVREVTIIIPNYNGIELLKNCIKTLEEQTCPDFKVLVVDNGSTDGSAEVRSEVLDLEVVALTGNTGFCGAVNIGIQHTGTPYVILLNNDTEADPEFVSELLAGIKKSDRLFSCGAMMLDYRNRELIDNAGDYYTALGWAVARGRGKRKSDFQREKYVFSCCGGASIYRRDLIAEIGAFDEGHFAYLEDVDIGYRARIFGYQNRYIPSARVYHIGSATTGTRYNGKKVFLAARNSVYLLYKNMPALQLLLNLPLIVVGTLLKAVFFAVKGLGREYIRGVVTGISNSKNCRRVPFRWGKLGSYMQIQVELWVNILRILCSV